MGELAGTAALWGVFAVVLVVACAASAGLSVVLRPLLTRYALARPNARSSHAAPTPQGGGVAVLGATLLATWLGVLLAINLMPFGLNRLAVLSIAAVLLALVGAIDDIRTLGPAPRFLAHFLAVGLVVAMLPDDFHVIDALPKILERALLVIGGVYFVNLVNFMDGLDLMTVAEAVPITAGFVLLGFNGVDWVPAMLVAVALLGAMLGFAPFNRPVARLFLGDVGSLPIGLILGWLMLMLAGQGYLAAALLLPLYYLADATITLGRRIVRGEKIWEAHRSHFYQLATARGFTVSEVIARVLLVNMSLVVLALISVVEPNPWADIPLVMLGAACVAWLLITLARGKS
ncbi:MAG TPA: glycosyltransferase family 4 protein [Xanthobacteraceae bacterium]|nr:glycosyltransferase family 4 protein [Xanthobacteraceae bacterium]